MNSLFQAHMVYRPGDDGYELDGYAVREFIDGYQVNETPVSLSEVLILDGHLQKFDRMLRRTETLTFLTHDVPQLQATLGGHRVPRLPDQSADDVATLRSRLAEQARVAKEECVTHLADLYAKTAAVRSAIQDATNMDGYQ